MHSERARVFLAATFAAAMFLIMSIPAAASPVTYTLTVGNSDLQRSKAIGPYANVTLDLLNGGKSITVTVQTLDDYILKTGNYLFGFNYTGSDALYLSNSPGLTLASSRSAMSDFGKFDYYIKPDNKKSLVDTLTFTVGRKNGQVFTNGVNDLLDYSVKDKSTSTPSLFALHVKSTSRDITGYTGGGTLVKPTPPPTPTPEPSSLALLGAGLITVGGFARRMRKKKNV